MNGPTLCVFAKDLTESDQWAVVTLAVEEREDMASRSSILVGTMSLLRRQRLLHR